MTKFYGKFGGCGKHDVRNRHSAGLEGLMPATIGFERGYEFALAPIRQAKQRCGNSSRPAIIHVLAGLATWG